jgi:hypothetical protein
VAYLSFKFGKSITEPLRLALSLHFSNSACSQNMHTLKALFSQEQICALAEGKFTLAWHIVLCRSIIGYMWLSHQNLLSLASCGLWLNAYKSTKKILRTRMGFTTIWLTRFILLYFDIFQILNYNKYNSIFIL